MNLQDKLNILPGAIYINEYDNNGFMLDLSKNDDRTWNVQYNAFSVLWPKSGYEKHNRCEFYGIPLEEALDKAIDWLKKNGYEDQLLKS